MLQVYCVLRLDAADRQEEEHIAKENQANRVLETAEDKVMSIFELEKKLMERETIFKELNLATIEELNG